MDILQALQNTLVSTIRRSAAANRRCLFVRKPPPARPVRPFVRSALLGRFHEGEARSRCAFVDATVFRPRHELVTSSSPVLFVELEHACMNERMHGYIEYPPILSPLAGLLSSRVTVDDDIQLEIQAQVSATAQLAAAPTVGLRLPSKFALRQESR